jgi:ABC-type multidrug transport system fused ATPase/permease subunit
MQVVGVSVAYDSATDPIAGAPPRARSVLRRVRLMRSFIRNAVVAMGRRALVWSVLGMISSLLLSVVELAISFFIQLFLRGLGLLAVEVKTPAWFSLRNPTPTDLALMLVAIAVVRAMVKYVVSQSGAVSMEMINGRLRRFAIYEMLLHPEQRTVSASTANVRINELFGKAAWFVNALADLSSNALQAGGLLLVMLFAAWRESMVALVGLFFMGLMVLALNRQNRAFAERVPAQLGVLVRGIERISRNVTLVRALRTERTEHERLVASIDAYASNTISASSRGSMVAALTPFVGTLLIVVIIVISQSLFHTDGLLLVSFLYLFFRFSQCIASAATQSSFCAQRWPQFTQSIAYAGTFTDAQRRVAMATALPPEPQTTERLPAPPPVRASTLGFTYPGAAEPVFSELELDVRAGEQLAIVGTSGSGKSTLLGLILGLFHPTHGDVRIGTDTPKDYFANPRVRVGYVGAEAFLIEGTIRSNLLYGARMPYDDATLWAALNKASLKVAVEGMAGNLDYAITEEGAGLSAGQKQRLCLARALLSEPHLLVLDEATANLDEATELEIAETLATLRGQCTTIVVSHRPGIIRHADRVVKMGQF